MWSVEYEMDKSNKWNKWLTYVRLLNNVTDLAYLSFVGTYQECVWFIYRLTVVHRA